MTVDQKADRWSDRELWKYQLNWFGLYMIFVKSNGFRILDLKRIEFLAQNENDHEHHQILFWARDKQKNSIHFWDRFWFKIIFAKWESNQTKEYWIELGLINEKFIGT